MSDREHQARQVERLGAWLQKHWTGSHNCAVCGSNDWTLNHVLRLPQYDETPDADGTISVMPTAAAVCLNCGYSLLFNAKISRLLDDDAAEPGDNGSSGNE